MAKKASSNKKPEAPAAPKTPPKKKGAKGKGAPEPKTGKKAGRRSEPEPDDDDDDETTDKRKASASERMSVQLAKLAEKLMKLKEKAEAWPNDAEDYVIVIRKSLDTVADNLGTAISALGDLPDNWPPKGSQIEIDYPARLKPSKVENYRDVFEDPENTFFTVLQVRDKFAVVQERESETKHRIPKGDLIRSA